MIRNATSFMNTLQWISIKDYDIFMASQLGQRMQTVVIIMTSIFAAFRAGEAVTQKSLGNAIPPLFYGASAFLAWSGQSAARRLLGADKIMDAVIGHESDYKTQIEILKKTQAEVEIAWTEAEEKVGHLQRVNEQLIAKLTALQGDLTALQKASRGYQEAAIQAKAAFDKVVVKKNKYKAENETLKQQHGIHGSS